MKDFECEATSRVAQDPNFSIAEVREGVATYLDNILVAYEKQPGGRKADASRQITGGQLRCEAKWCGRDRVSSGI